MNNIKTLSIDIETRSSVDLAKCGVYRYVESPDFDILLFAVSVNGGPVAVYDLACGDKISDEILSALADNSVIKYSYNAGFERICLTYWLRRNRPCLIAPEDYLSPRSWRCDLVLAAYNGLPLSLAQVGEALGLAQQKMKEGKDLIRYFCAPSRTAGRDWNLPEHAPEKWELFKQYNKRDVEVEMQIHDRLQNYPVPDSVWDEYHLSEEINDRGIMIDRELVDQAIRIDALTKADITEKMKTMTGLENPGSVMQLKGWLAENGIKVDTLGKKDVLDLIGKTPPHIAEVLSLRLRLARSSVKKYQAMQNSVCLDGRCHGMFFFYGANRTGRFSSRVIQIQNLYRNSMPDLEQVRDLVKAGDYEMLGLLYDDVPEVLAQLIRTAFVPRPGYRFIVSDFSAIEARVLSFLAGEKWRAQVFSDGGDIYCESASRMFGVPVEKHGQNAHLRQKGKIAELACIAEGQLVLTDRGLVPIEKITLSDRLWDGKEWVDHEGVIYKGEREVITYDGLTATSDHLVFVEGQQEPIQLGLAAASGARLVQTGNGGEAIRLGRDHQSGEAVESGDESLLCPDKMSGLRLGAMADPGQSHLRKVKRMPAVFTAQNGAKVAVQKAVGCQTAMRESECPGISKLRCKRNPFRFPLCDGGSPVSDQNIRSSGPFHADRPNRHERKLRPWESPICNKGGEPGESQEHSSESFPAGILALLRNDRKKKTGRGTVQRRDHRISGKSCSRAKEELANNKRTARLYDIRNAGKHHRFTVSGKLVHNCGYGGAVGAMKAMGGLDMGLSEEDLQSIVSDWRAANPNITAYWWAVDAAVKTAVKQRTRTHVGNITFEMKSGMLFIELPSGRRLAYAKPRIGENQFGGESVTYMGTDAQKKWSRIESYGPKFTENIVQAISRDILAYAMQALQDYRIVGHVHDEVIIEARPDVSVDTICELMGRTPLWVPGLLLRADGYECDFYRKD